MDLRRPAALLLLAALAAPGSRAAVIPTGWPKAPGDGLRAATINSLDSAADLSIEPGRSGDLFLAWTESTGDTLRVQRLSDAGSQAFGVSGTVVRSGAGLGIATAASRRPEDSRGRFDLFPTTDGGVLVAWTELTLLGRDLRVQRLGPTGTALFAAGGVTLLTELSTSGEDAAVAADGSDGAFACAVLGASGQGVLRYNRVRDTGGLDFPVPGRAIDTTSGPKEGPSIAAFPNHEAAICWIHPDTQELRMQIVAGTSLRLAADGAVLGLATEGWASMRAAGSSIPGSMLIAHRLADAVRVLLVTAFGTVQRAEEAGSAELAGPPVLTAANAVVSALPEGIEVKGRLAAGGAVQFVRSTSGAWLKPLEVHPPAALLGNGADARTGPGWVFDLGPSTTNPAGRVAAYRPTAADPDTLDPTLGPWLAIAPGEVPFLRVADGGTRVFSAWVTVSGGTKFILAARAGAFGGQDVFDLRGLALQTLKVKRPAGGAGTLTARAPEAVLAADVDPETEAAAFPSLFRVRAGSERGVTADLHLVSWKGSRALNWKATVSDVSGDVKGTVQAGPLGRGLRISLKGLPVDAAERVAWVRIDLEDRSRAATVTLTPKGKTGKTASFKGP